jgi:glycosyltransferase 2 family protein
VADPRLRHWLWTLLRLALCTAAVAYVVSRTDFSDKTWLRGQEAPVQLVRLAGGVADVIDAGQSRTVPVEQLQTVADGTPRITWGLASLAARSDKSLFLLAILVFGIHPLLQVVRFRWMLSLQGIPIDWRTAAGICFTGNFYSYVIPGTTGGDIVRAAYLMRHHVNRHGALVAIALDRLTGMAGLFALAGLAGALISITDPTVRYAAGVSVLIFGAMVAGFAAVTGWQWVVRLLGRLPLGSHLQQLYEAASVGRSRWPVLLASVGLTMVLQAGAMTAFTLAAKALGMQPPWQQYFVCLPVSLVIASIPIGGPSGLGTQEAAMVFLLAGHAGSVSQVVGLAFAMRILGLIWALPGGLIPLFQSAPPVTASVAQADDNK